jgi:hypothetical protein
VKLHLYPEQPLSDVCRATTFHYLASPYSRYPHGMEAAFRAACEATAVLMRQGHRVFSPIAHSHPIGVHGLLPLTDHNLWMAADRPFMDSASGCLVLMLEGWQESIGVKHEIEVFTKAGKPIEYLMVME